MYIELLKQYAAHLNSVKFHPAATANQVCEAEKRLNVLFPDELKKILFEVNGDNFLLWSLEQIVKENLEIRSINPEIIEPELFNFSEFLFIAGNGIGDYYGYRIDNGTIQSTSIFVFEHEEYTSKVVAHNIAELVMLYYQDQI